MGQKVKQLLHCKQLLQNSNNVLPRHALVLRVQIDPTNDDIISRLKLILQCVMSFSAQ